MNNKPKILIYDIETAPNIGYSWGKWEQNIIDFKQEWYILSFCAKWLDKKKIISYKLNDFNLFKKDKTNDLLLCKELWKLIDEADVVIAHNGDKFDIKKMNTRFIFHKLPPPSPYKSIDTKKLAKKYFNFNSNSLNDLGKYLHLGSKIEHEGFSLWLKCMNGDKKAWNKMIKYNKGDVILLEKIYKRFLGWIQNHPNYNVYNNLEMQCPNCGSKKLIKNGIRVTRTHKYQRYRCNNCGAHCQSVHSEKLSRALIK